MSAISTFQSLPSIFRVNYPQFARQNPSFFAIPLRRNAVSAQNFPHLSVTHKSKSRRVRSAEEAAEIPEAASGAEEEVVEQNVAVPVSPSEKLIMFFQAEGTMNDSAIPAVTQALEGTEGISDLKVQISEGIASVELTKQTTIQATGVASSLLDTIQGAGFKLQTLNLSFEDDELAYSLN